MYIDAHVPIGAHRCTDVQRCTDAHRYTMYIGRFTLDVQMHIDVKHVESHLLILWYFFSK